MKLSLLWLFLGAAGAARGQSGAPLTKFDVLAYNYAIAVNDDNDTIEVEAVIELKALRRLDAIDFDLANAGEDNGKGMSVEKLSCNLPQPYTYAHKNDRLRIALRADSGQTVTVAVSYKGIPANGLIIGKNKFGNRTFFGDNWPNRAHHWLVCVDHPADKASIEWRVAAPAHYTVVANGVETGVYHHPGGGRTVWVFREDHPIPVKVAVIGVAVMQKQLAAGYGCLPVYNYVYPETDKKGLAKMSAAGDIIQFFSNTLGEYPYRKLANVQSTTMFGGMENANTIFYDEEMVDNNENIDALLAHEIAHQWFGNTVTEKSFAHLWLSEGFATFLTHYYLEKKYGTDTLQQRLRADRAKVRKHLNAAPGPVVDSSSNYMRLLNANSYQKGALFLQAIREKTGEAVFLSIIRTFYNRFKYANAGTEDFKKVVEDLTGGNWQPFFREWLYSTKLPD